MLRRSKHSKNEVVAPEEEEDCYCYIFLLGIMYRKIHRSNYAYNYSFCLLNFMFPTFRPNFDKVATPNGRLSRPAVEHTTSCSSHVNLCNVDVLIYTGTVR